MQFSETKIEDDAQDQDSPKPQAASLTTGTNPINSGQSHAESQLLIKIQQVFIQLLPKLNDKSDTINKFALRIIEMCREQQQNSNQATSSSNIPLLCPKKLTAFVQVWSHQLLLSSRPQPNDHPSQNQKLALPMLYLANHILLMSLKYKSKMAKAATHPGASSTVSSNSYIRMVADAFRPHIPGAFQAVAIAQPESMQKVHAVLGVWYHYCPDLYEKKYLDDVKRRVNEMELITQMHGKTINSAVTCLVVEVEAMSKAIGGGSLESKDNFDDSDHDNNPYGPQSSSARGEIEKQIVQKIHNEGLVEKMDNQMVQMLIGLNKIEQVIASIDQITAEKTTTEKNT